MNEWEKGREREREREGERESQAGSMQSGQSPTQGSVSLIVRSRPELKSRARRVTELPRCPASFFS